MASVLPSLVICGSVISHFDAAYLSHLRSSILHNPRLTELKDALIDLPELWSLLIQHEPFLEAEDVMIVVRNLVEWIEDDNSSKSLATMQPFSNVQSAILTILVHFSEYMAYLNSHELSAEVTDERLDAHAQILYSARDGGIQGLCVGLLTATGFACSQNIEDLSKNGAIALRLALCIGALVDLDQTRLAEPTTCISTRWSGGEDDIEEEVLKEILSNYPQSYISVRPDVKSATITVPKGCFVSMMRHLGEAGVAAKPMDLHGRYHHLDYTHASQKLARLCESLPMLRFPPTCRPLVPLRWNDDGRVVTEHTPLHEMVIKCILAKPADWHTTISNSVREVMTNKESIRDETKSQVLALGPVDCVPRSIVAGNSIRVTRFVANEKPHRSYPDDSIAVIGLSCQFGDSHTPEKFWEVMKNNIVNTSFSASGSFDTSFFRKSPREAQYMDPQHRLGLHLAFEALDSGGYFNPSSKMTDNIGCFIGMSSCDYEQNVNSHTPSAFSFTGTARAFSSGRISHFFGLTGPSMVIDTACSSSGVAIHTACQAIQSGECQMALAGGINLMTPEARSHCNLEAASFLSPTGQCRPFDINADGYCRGEGGGLVLLKKLSTAVMDHDYILGVLVASSVNNSKGNRSITLPSGESQSDLFRRVLQKANMDPHQISYIEAHGTGTKKGDPIECQSITNVFAGRPESASHRVQVGSVKGNVGHNEAASGIASLVKVLLMFQNGQIPPQANFSTLNPAISSIEGSVIEVPSYLKPWNENFRAALVNNYGASGTNVAMILCQPPPAQRTCTSKLDQYPITIAAHSTLNLQEYCRSLLSFIKDQKDNFGQSFLAAVAFGLAQRQLVDYRDRLSLCAGSIEELEAQLNTYLQQEQEGTKAKITPENSKPVVLVFSGQTGRQALCSPLVYKDCILLQHHLNECDRTLRTMGLRGLFPHIFENSAVDDTVSLHCMQFSLQYATAMSWIDCGLAIKAVIGHSLGQLTALCVSGVLSLQDALTMISGRAMMIQKLWGSNHGCMLSVEGDVAAVKMIIRSLSKDYKVEIACYNATFNQIVVGNEESITAFEEIARFHAVPVKRLGITYAFHSEMLDSILPEYERLLQGLTIRSPTIDLEPCSEADGSWDKITPELISRQSREPVYFVHAISRLEQKLGPCIWLEAGSGSAGVTMARRAITGNHASHRFYSIKLHGEEPLKSLSDTTIRLWDDGVRVQFWMYHGFQRNTLPHLKLPPYSFNKSREWLHIVKRPMQSNLEPHSANEPPNFVSLLGSSDGNTTVFSINQDSHEYSIFVRGRAVFGNFLTPSSVYMAAAKNALAILQKRKVFSQQNRHPVSIEGMKLHAPFGMNLQKRLQLTLQNKSETSWKFMVESIDISITGSVPKLQASGFLRVHGEDFSNLASNGPLHRLLYDQCQELRKGNSGSTVQGAFVNQLLSKVANYDERYLSIHTITAKGSSAVATVARPTIADKCDTEGPFSPPIFDNILLVAELHASIVGDLLQNEVYICQGIDRIAPNHYDRDMATKSDGPWTVLSTMQKQDNIISCDILIFDAHQKSLSLSVLGAKFVRVPCSSLQKRLEVINDCQRASSQTLQHHTTSQTNFERAIPLQDAEVIGFGSKVSPITFPTDLSGSATSNSGKSTSDITPKSSVSPTIAEATSISGNNDDVALLSLLSEHLNCSQSMSPDTRLGDIGLDSLITIQLQSDIEKLFGKRIGLGSIDENSTFSNLCALVLQREKGPKSGPIQEAAGQGEGIRHEPDQPNDNDDLATFTPKIESLTSLDGPIPQISKPGVEVTFMEQATSTIIRSSGFDSFYTRVYPKQMSLVIAYILEAFTALGCNLQRLGKGDAIPQFDHRPKYQSLVGRLYQILQDADLISRHEGQSLFHRTAEAPPTTKSAAELSREILRDFPLYQPDHNLLSITGPHLADCLSGQTDPLHLLFKNPETVKSLEDVYVKSPLFSIGNKMLQHFIRQTFPVGSKEGGSKRLRIIEIGAGTGATTRVVLDQLMAADVEFFYTFTDISPALVASAKKTFSALYGELKSNIEFTVFDAEKPIPEEILGSYDVAISSNCIHATKNLNQSCSNIARLLRKDVGILALIELTRPLPWLDCVFGLLDGWWRFDDGRTYALASEKNWKETLLNAGFQHVQWTDDSSRESSQLRLIIARR